MNTHEVVLFIHGISPNEKLGTVEKRNASIDTGTAIDGEARKDELSHQLEYKALADGIGRYIRAKDRKSIWQSANRCYIEWGWEYRETDARLGSSHRLIDAQLNLTREVIAATRRSFVGGLSMHPIRKLELMGISDVIYYLSPDGNRSIKSRLYHQISNELEFILKDDEAQVSLTVIGHSAGSVISLDLVSFLTSNSEKAIEEPEVDATTRLSTDESVIPLSADAQADSLSVDAPVAPPFGHKQGLIVKKLDPNRRKTKIGAVVSETSNFLENQNRLRQMLANKRIILRRLVTMGSPIAMMVLRSDQHIRSWAYGSEGELNNCETFGIPRGLDPDDKPYWINIWDKFDPISFPVEPIAASNGSIKDYQIRVGFVPIHCHLKYWNNKKVHKLIADLW